MNCLMKYLLGDKDALPIFFEVNELTMRIYFFVPLFFVLSSLFLQANDIISRPEPPRMVNDMAGFLTPNQRIELEQRLVEYARQSSTQLVFVSVPDLKGYEKADYAVRLAHDWGIGQEGKDNGILILVKPKTAGSSGEVFIATGYGIEEYVPDAVAKRIVENDMLPYFRQQQNYQGVRTAVERLIDLTQGKYTAEAYMQQQGTEGFPWGVIFFLLIFTFVPLLSRLSHARRTSVGKNIPFWVAMGLLMSSSRSTGRGSFGNFSSGSGSFGGFGGGGFGGGGAGGSW